jgi:CheY-like chemotaxis protein
MSIHMRGTRLLIVDDSPTVLSLLQLVFEGDNYEVATARDGMEGLEKVRHWKPDLIVTDSVMPNIDGFELLRILKSDPATREIPVIMLTGSDQADPTQAARLQPDALASKSADWSELLALARNLLQGRAVRSVSN